MNDYYNQAYNSIQNDLTNYKNNIATSNKIALYHWKVSKDGYTGYIYNLGEKYPMYQKKWYLAINLLIYGLVLLIFSSLSKTALNFLYYFHITNYHWFVINQAGYDVFSWIVLAWSVGIILWTIGVAIQFLRNFKFDTHKTLRTWIEIIALIFTLLLPAWIISLFVIGVVNNPDFTGLNFVALSFNIALSNLPIHFVLIDLSLLIGVVLLEIANAYSFFSFSANTHFLVKTSVPIYKLDQYVLQ